MLKGSVRLALAGGDDLFRGALAFSLSRDGVQVAGSFRSVADLLTAPIEPAPQMVILIGAPIDEMGALDWPMVGTIRDRYSDVRIVMLAGDYVGEEDATTILEAGVDSFLLRDISVETLSQSLELTMSGQQILPRQLAGHMGAGSAPTGRTGPAGHATANLTRAERKVLALLCEGHSNKLIARRLEISEATVKVHVRHMLKKIGAANRTQAALWATAARNGAALSGGALRAGRELQARPALVRVPNGALAGTSIAS